MDKPIKSIATVAALVLSFTASATDYSDLTENEIVNINKFCQVKDSTVALIEEECLRFRVKILRQMRSSNGRYNLQLQATELATNSKSLEHVIKEVSRLNNLHSETSITSWRVTNKIQP